MKYSRQQIERSVNKLAKTLGRWNKAGLDDEQRRDVEPELFMAAFQVIKKSGMSDVYFKIRKKTK
jgi:hypothetical protein